MSPGGSSIIGGAGGGGGGGGGGPVGLGPDGKLSAGYYGGSQHSLPGLTQPPRQKGRPRKRKPKDLEAMTANLGELIRFRGLLFIQSIRRRVLSVTSATFPCLRI